MNVELGMLNVELVAYGDVELFNYEFKIRQFLIAGVAENNNELGMLNVELVAYGDVELFNCEFKIRQFLIAGVAENNSKLQIQNSKFASSPLRKQ